MANQQQQPPSRAWVLMPVALALVAVPTFLLGIYLAATDRGWAMLAAGCASLVALGIAWPVWRAIETTRDAQVGGMNEFTGPFNERMQQISVLLNQISEQQLISDRTKQVAYRNRDREAVRRAIHEEINDKDWEAALALASDIEQVFGYKQEADRFRREIEHKRTGETRRLVGEGIADVERYIRIERWQDALAEAHKVAQAYPGDEQAHNLPQHVEQRRANHKKQLIESWQDAINRRDIDGSIEILRKLDPYLTPQEAEAMQEPARNLFKEKLNALRTQLSLAIQDHKWREAYKLSETIIRDFPNTRIAHEVSERIDELRQRVAQEGAEETEAAPA